MQEYGTNSYKITGYFLIAYFGLVLAIGVLSPCIQRVKDKDMYGKVSTTQICCHVCVAGLLIAWCLMPFLGFYVIIPAVFLYLIKFCLCQCLHEHIAFQNMHNLEQIDQLLTQIREQIPNIYFQCECSHVVLVQVPVGNQMQTRYDKVITYNKNYEVPLIWIKDKTPALYITENAPVIFIKLKEQFQMMGDSLILEGIQNRIYQENRFRDQDCNIYLNQVLPGIKQKYFLKSRKHCWISLGMLWISMLLQFDVLYVGIIRSLIPKTVLPVIKCYLIDQMYARSQYIPATYEKQENEHTNPEILEPKLVIEQNTQPLTTKIKPDYLNSLIKEQKQTVRGKKDKNQIQNQQEEIIKNISNEPNNIPIFPAF
ncbi:Transmembrane_domain-containing protein [Hexamita inflata]|uniref:Transmembrane domain-containing protein n=1 Tax=Hexamita inflata TaxID=28002 RepID=A0AA86TCT3_9EUKA|nr:Transmembrane domain-containing protein [Hexamita inflata]CAI9934712.1 Transmembrane domain-containing protein [Hexamita inflata]